MLLAYCCVCDDQHISSTHTQAYEFDIAVGIEFAHTDPMLCFYTAAFMNADHMAGCVSGCSVNITIG